jgi:hypothetical protein
MTKDESVETQLGDVKRQLDRVLNRLDALVRLEEQHNNTVSSLNRAHRDIEKLDVRVDKVELIASKNNLMTRAMERIGWMIVSAAIGLAAYLLR